MGMGCGALVAVDPVFTINRIAVTRLILNACFFALRCNPFLQPVEMRLAVAALSQNCAEQGIKIGHYKASRLLSESNLASKQPGPHKYKRTIEERSDIPNL